MKILPHNIEYEESLLSHMLISRNIDDLFDAVKPEHFYREYHRVIFEAGLKIHRSKQDIEPAAILTALKDAGIGPDVCGASFIFKIMDQCPSPVNVAQYCTRVRELHAMRETIVACNSIMGRCYECGEGAGDILAEAQSEILSIDIGGSGSSFVSMPDLTQESLSRYEEVQLNTDDGESIYTGFVVLDRIIGGFKGEKFIVIAGRPGTGKTAIAMNMIRTMANALVHVGIFSIEMPPAELDDRFFAIETGINSMLFTRGAGASETQMAALVEAAKKKHGWNVTIDGTGGLTIDELCRRAKIMKKNGVEIIFIDQLSKIRGGVGNSRFEKKSDIVERVNDLKKTLGIPIVLLAQINRKVGDSADKKPTLFMLKDTGQLEEDPDIVLLLHLEEDGKNFSCNIAKHRQGAIFDVPLVWEASTTRFYNGYIP